MLMSLRVLFGWTDTEYLLNIKVAFS